MSGGAGGAPGGGAGGPGSYGSYGDPNAGGYGSSTFGGSYGTQSPFGNTNWSTGPTTGGGAGAGGYNPQLMPGQGNDTVFQGGTPFWQPWVGWNEMAGTSNTPQGNFDAAAQATPGAPAWLQHQYGDYLQQPFYTNPNQYGRFNWATNMQGGGIPSPFGQYAQQTATYPNLQFPPPPQPPGGGGPAQPPGPPAPPTGGPTPPTGKPAISDPMELAALQAKAFGYGSPQYQAALQQFGGQAGLNAAFTKYGPGSGTTNDWAQYSSPLDFGYHLAGGQWVK